MFHGENYREIEKANVVYFWKQLIIIPRKTKLNSKKDVTFTKHNWHQSKKASFAFRTIFFHQKDELFIWTTVTIWSTKKAIGAVMKKNISENVRCNFLRGFYLKKLFSFKNTKEKGENGDWIYCFCWRIGQNFSSLSLLHVYNLDCRSFFFVDRTV
jgi:hypothetical protein